VRTLLLTRRYETIALRSSVGSASALFANLNSVATFPTSSGLGIVQLLVSLDCVFDASRNRTSLTMLTLSSSF
jgi:hypothetical protein